MKKEQVLYEMMWYIQNKKEFTAQELADRFHLSIRSVYRYITDLADLGLYVDSKKGRNGGFTVLANQVLPPVLFTEDEITALYFAIQSLQNFEDFPFQMNTITAGEKLLAVVPQKMQEKLLHLEDHFQLSTPRQVVENSFLSELMRASMDHLKVEIDYHSPKRQSIKQLEPIGIYANNGFWYLFAFDAEQEETRHYRADRIQRVTILEEPSKTELTLAELDKEFIPKKPIKMKVELTEKGVRQCMENRYLYKGIIPKEHGGVLELMVAHRDIPYTTTYLLLLGKEAKVIEPPELVDHLRQRVQEIEALYQ
ncbi:helix-turn-helix transcriptional regulator [Candidatus Enterococcus clewellii]|uniref:HTH deoR-type domain-containing protein n=1 Tax=Candidatus Enterococcus clewellii TaxID=1834193 RepID=A0A242K7S1_9ENTE|nr:YafY family protein [Enterococcus sp. 9E7_DIV0242]OTP15975.1 hypothetical protein A5888_002189 [Enterococcus sp. 9E7_DIV0242]